MAIIFPKEIIKSRRRTISLIINKDGEFVIRCPVRIKDAEIQSIVEQKQKWIQQKLAQYTERKNHKTKLVKIYQEGENFLYLGQNYPLKIVQNQKESLKFDQEFLLSENKVSVAREVLQKWYKKQAKLIISQRVDEYSQLYALKYRNIRISSAKHRWGSCSGKNNLNFNWKLVMTPLEVLDYVIIHELVHTRIKNHSSQFWQKVEEIYPNYKFAKLWLKENHDNLVI